MQNQILLALIIIISICGAIITALDIFQTILSIKNKQKNKEEEIIEKDLDPKLVEVLLKENTIETIDKLIDQCIKDAGDIYNIMILSPNQLVNGNSSYITEKEQQEMSEYIYQNLMKTRINSTLKKIIGYTYKVDTEEELESVIRLRIKLYMLNFINQYNALIEK